MKIQRVKRWEVEDASAMMGQEGGLHIVNTSSVAGKVGSPVSACYAATKHAVQGYFDSLRMELGHRG